VLRYATLGRARITVIVTVVVVRVWLSDAGEVDAASPSNVRLEIAQMAGAPLESPQQWLQSLDRVGLAGIRIRAARPGDVSRVEQRGDGANATFQVLAVLNRRGELELPGRVRIRTGGVGQLQAWLENLAPQQTEGSGGDADRAFGLSDRELVGLYEQLATPVDASTVGESRAKLLVEIGKSASVPLEVRPDVRRQVVRSGPVQDELKGVSSGTALAALLRPLNLVMVPLQTSPGQFAMRIRREQSVVEAWPIGWPSEKTDAQTLPVLLETFPVEISDTPLTTAVSALQQRLAVPVLFDWKAINAKQLKLDEVKVNVPRTKTYYKRVLSRVLSRARLEMNVRVDEAQRPFIWVRPIQLDR